MATQSATTVRMFGALHSVRKDRGLASTVEVDIPAEGCTARDLAVSLELPLEKVDAVFINNKAYLLKEVVHRGDRVAFIPTGILSAQRLLQRRP